MSKSIELTSTQIKAYESGATMFLFLIDQIKNPSINKFLDNLYSFNCIDGINNFIQDNSPIQKGDRDIFVQEEFRLNEYGDYEYKKGLNTKVTSHLNINQWQKASQMTKEQSRYSFSECIDVKVVRGETGYNFEIKFKR